VTTVLYYGVKRGTQNIQNDCYRWLSRSFRVHQIRFQLGLCPYPTGRAYSTPPDPLGGLRGPTSKGERKGKEEKRKGRGEEEKGRDRPPPNANSSIGPCISREQTYVSLSDIT